MPGIFLSIIHRLKYFFRVRNMKLRGTLPSWILRVPSPGGFIHFFIFSCQSLPFTRHIEESQGIWRSKKI